MIDVVRQLERDGGDLETVEAFLASRRCRKTFLVEGERLVLVEACTGCEKEGGEASEPNVTSYSAEIGPCEKEVREAPRGGGCEKLQEGAGAKSSRRERARSLRGESAQGVAPSVPSTQEAPWAEEAQQAEGAAECRAPWGAR